jgi:hypothetical protein
MILSFLHGDKLLLRSVNAKGEQEVYVKIVTLNVSAGEETMVGPTVKLFSGYKPFDTITRTNHVPYETEAIPKITHAQLTICKITREGFKSRIMPRKPRSE